MDEHGRIACARVDENSATYVRLAHGASLIIERMDVTEFLSSYTYKPDYTPGRAALIMVHYSTLIGATREALEFLGVEDDGVISDATGRFRPPTEEVLKAKPRKKTEPKETNSRGVEWGGEKYNSMADMIRKMLAAGEDDDVIFEAMKGAYNAPESKRHYIDYYRKQLEKANGTKREKTRRKRVRHDSVKDRRSRKKSA